MFISKLICLSCGYESEDFSDGINLHSETYSFVIQNEVSKEIIIKEIPEQAIKKIKIDIGSAGVELLLQKAICKENESLIIIPLAEFDVSIEVECPNCNSNTLMKVLCGMQ